MATTTAPERPRLIYVYDALCGWCYGFSPVMQRAQERYRDHMDIEVISGGMVTGSRIGPIGQVAGYIKTAYKDVEQATGVKFGEGFLKGTLEKGTATFTSVQPAIALAVVRGYKPELALDFAHALQHAIYYDGIAPADAEAYIPYAEKFGISAEAFRAGMADKTMEQQAIKEFRTSDSLKVSGYPAVFVLRNNVLHKVANGYTAEKTFFAQIDQVLSGK